MIEPLRAMTETESPVLGHGSTLQPGAAPEPSRIVVAALESSTVRIEPLAGSDALATATLRSELGARETECGTLISLPGDVLFDSDRHEIRDGARPTLAKLAELIDRTPGARVLVEGHTVAKGSGSYNQILSERRARAVAEWLARRAGVDAARLEERGYGESRPVAPNARPDGCDDPEGRQLNRRVEVILPRQ
jgi:outer membrane protein OmpA-like peptidoglycan-associated protein